MQKFLRDSWQGIVVFALMCVGMAAFWWYIFSISGPFPEHGTPRQGPIIHPTAGRPSPPAPRVPSHR